MTQYPEFLQPKYCPYALKQNEADALLTENNSMDPEEWNPPPVTTTTPDMDAYIHHVDFNTRVVVTTARGIVTVMVYHRDEYVYDGNDDIPLTVPNDVRVIDTINFASCDYLSQLHVITNANQCAVAVDAVKQILNNPTELVLHKVK